VSDHKCMQRTAGGAEVPLGKMRYLKASDIDSQRVVIRIRGGKGHKDRDVMLSPKLLDALSVYWRQLRYKPTNWLFPAIDGIPQVILSPPRPLVLWTGCQNAAERADLAQKHIHPHTGPARKGNPAPTRRQHSTPAPLQTIQSDADRSALRKPPRRHARPLY